MNWALCLERLRPCLRIEITMTNQEYIDRCEDGLVSIIMPSWNTAKYIGESIESVINQTYTNWELLIVDDCSTDN